MSEENIEEVRRGFRVLDREGVRAAIELWHPEVEFDFSGVFPAEGQAEGGMHFVEAPTSYTSNFEQWRCDPTELIGLNPDRVLVMVRDGGRRLQVAGAGGF